MSHLSLHDPLNNHDSYHHDPVYSTQQQGQQPHYTHHPDPNQRGHFQQQQQQGLGQGSPQGLGQQYGGHEEGTYVGR